MAFPAFTLGDAVVRVSASTKSFNKALGDAERRAKRSFGNIGKLAGNMGRAFAVVGGGIITGMGLMTRSWMNAGDEIDKLSRKTGFSATALSEYRHAADLSGASLKTLDKAIKKMQRTITEAGDEYKRAAAKGNEATGEYTEALAMLGLSYQELQDLSPEKQFEIMTMRLADVSSATEKAGIAQIVFGRSGADLIPMLDSGAEGLKKMRDEAHELGIVFDKEAAAEAAQFKDDMDRLKKSGMSVAFAIARAIAPNVQNLANRIRDAVPKITDWIKNNEGLILTIGKVAGVLAASAPFLIGLNAFATSISTIVKVIGFAGVGGLALVPALVGLLGILDMLKNREQGYTNFIQRWADKWEWLGEKIDDAFDALVRWMDLFKEAMDLGGPQGLGDSGLFGRGGSGFGGGNMVANAGGGSNITNTTNYGPSNVSVNLSGVNSPEAFARQLASIMRRRKL